MITILKLASVSAVLSAGLVTAYETPKPAAVAQTKLYYDRIAPEPVAPVLVADGSADAPQRASMSDAAPNCGAWPYAAADCASGPGAAEARKVRLITIERRDQPNTSTLVRVPAGR